MQYLWLILCEPWFLGGVAVVLAQIVFGPVMCFFTVRNRVDVRFREIVPEDSGFDMDSEQFHRQSVSELLALGFDFLVYATMEQGTMPRQQVVITMFRHPETSAWAVCYAVVSRNENHPALKAQAYEFQTTFVNGREILTSAIDDVPVYHKRPTVTAIRLKRKQTSVPRLYELHRQMVNHFGSGTSIDSAAKDPISLLTESCKAESEYQAKMGLLTRTQDGTHWRMTIRGALVMTWKLIWPITLIPRTVIWLKRRRILNQLRATTSSVKTAGQSGVRPVQ